MIEIETREDLLEAKARHRNLVLRNWLNGIFMIVAAVAMIGIFVYRNSPQRLNQFYIIAVIAVIIKMVEAILRMPGILRKPKGLNKSIQKKTEDYD